MDRGTKVTVLKHGAANVRELKIICPDCGTKQWIFKVITEPPVSGQITCDNCGAVLEYLEIY